MTLPIGVGRLLSMRQETALLFIVKMMKFWTVSMDELQAGWDDAVKQRSEEFSKRDQEMTRQAYVESATAVKYRHPKSGKTWNGQGKHPDWLRHALLNEGYKVADLRPNGQGKGPAKPDPRRLMRPQLPLPGRREGIQRPVQTK